jgi:hypothetical protein
MRNWSGILKRNGEERRGQMPKRPDQHGNKIAKEGVDRCACGCKYWEHDRCVDCGAHVSETKQEEA